jgi:hypothetical protein
MTYYYTTVDTLLHYFDMAYSQIRINKTKELQEMLRFLKSQLKLLSESDIIKLALSEFYRLRHVVKYSNVEPVEFGPLPEEEVTPELRKKADEARRLYKEHPDRFIDIQ